MHAQMYKLDRSVIYETKITRPTPNTAGHRPGSRQRATPPEPSRVDRACGTHPSRHVS